MGGVLTIRAVVREQMKLAVDAAADKFKDALAPVYGSSVNGTPVHIGTCIFIRYKSQRFLLTAAHIIDENRNSSLYVGASGEMQEIAGTFQSTNSPGGDRTKDHYDFAWLRLDRGSPLQIPETYFVSEQDIEVAYQSGHMSLYLALGFPNSRNKKVDVANRSVTPQRMKYSSMLKDMPELCEKMGVSGEHHLFIGHDRKHSKDADENVVNTLKPRGSSGGALINLGEIAAPRTLLQQQLPEPRLVGMLIENPKYHDVLVAVRIGLILQQVERNAL